MIRSVEALGIVAAALAALLASAQERAFDDATVTSGLAEWRSVYGTPTDKRLILETMGPGVGLVDLDADGHLDAYLVSGVADASDGGRNALYRGRGNADFVAAPVHSGVVVSGWFYGVAAADYDNDGLTDLYVTEFGANRLWRNNGDGSFADVTSAAGAAVAGWSTGASWSDTDLDGNVDLMIVNYVEFDPRTVPGPGEGPFCTWKHLDVPCGPRGMAGDAAVLLRNRGDGTLEPATLEPEHGGRYYGLGVVWADLVGDGHPEAYVADDQTPNRLFLNVDGTLSESGDFSGAAYNEDGRPEAGMGTDAGDFDGDGLLDLFVTNFADESNTLYRNAGDGIFVDETVARGLALPSFRYLAWGTSFQDLDQDGDEDLFVANGHVYSQVDEFDLVDSYPQRNQVFLNAGGTFRELVPEPQDGLAAAAVSRGAAFGDVDGDGDVDVLVGNVDGSPQLLLNRLASGGAVRVRLVGSGANRRAVGARVRVTPSGGKSLIEEVRAGHSYLSQSSFDLHFGLGAAPEATVEIRWPAPGVEFDDIGTVAAGALVLVYETGRIVVAGPDPASGDSSQPVSARNGSTPDGSTPNGSTPGGSASDDSASDGPAPDGPDPASGG